MSRGTGPSRRIDNDLSRLPESNPARPDRAFVKRYRSIVADPPWPYDDERPLAGQRATGRGFLPYPSMSIDAISALPVNPMAQGDRVDGLDGSRLFLWTTTRFLVDAHRVAKAWGFRPTAVLVWCKPPLGRGVGGTFASNVEFVLHGRKAHPPAATEDVPTRWFEWPRAGHSEKPEAFLDLVERVSPGPYLELFARRARFGWDYWGDQSLGTAGMVA